MDYFHRYRSEYKYEKSNGGFAVMGISIRDWICTIDDIYALPDGECVELVEGKMYCMDSASRTHQKLQHFFDRMI